jgi:hypothetical protein
MALLRPCVVVLLLFCCLVLVLVVPGGRATEGDDEDILRPYADEDDATGAGWGPAVRTHRELLHAMNHAERAVLLAGEGEGSAHHNAKRGLTTTIVNNTHEIFTPQAGETVPDEGESEGQGEGDEAAWVAKYLGDHPDIESRRFVEVLPDRSTVFGHVFYISNPQRHFTVQPPAGVRCIACRVVSRRVVSRVSDLGGAGGGATGLRCPEHGVGDGAGRGLHRGLQRGLLQHQERGVPGQPHLGRRRHPEHRPPQRFAFARARHRFARS